MNNFLVFISIYSSAREKIAKAILECGEVKIIKPENT